MVDAFHLRAHWPARQLASDPTGATFCRLKIQVGSENVTLYNEVDGREHDHLEIPAYYLAEWIAENWWPLLWEPHKSDNPLDDPSYRARHSFLAAQSGFALPDLWVTPTGDQLALNVRPRSPVYADVKFTKAARSTLKRSAVEGELRRFVDETARRIPATSGTLLQELWNIIESTDDDSSEYCRLMGALGLSPYDEHPSIDRALDAAQQHLSKEQQLDLCFSSKPDDIVASAFAAVRAQVALKGIPGIDLSRLSSVPRPADNPHVPAWRTGKRAADNLGSALKGNHSDLACADRLFEVLDLDDHVQRTSEASAGDLPITGVTKRQGDCGQMAILPPVLTSRRFAAARGAYFLWTSKSNDARLMTMALTRDQQISRAFAAEFLVPFEYIRARARNMRLDRAVADEIASEARVAPDVVRFQAINQGVQLVN